MGLSLDSTHDPLLSLAPERDIYTISRLNREARGLLEREFSVLWVRGEISNFSVPSSGHWYFTLKDRFAQVRCAMFRMRNRLVGMIPQDGTEVLVRARVSLYENRGDFQLLVELLEEAGDGALRRAFEVLKQRLAAEGLFDSAHKKPLPHWPTRIGIITSPTGAALRDVLSVLRRRCPSIEVMVYPVPVQGETAAPEITSMLQVANARHECDVLLLARGGGSLEDLWAFNEESVARAIYQSRLPVVTGVGHEIDFTIADFVADHRAPTPSAAAELLSPNQQEWFERVTRLSERLLDLHKQHRDRARMRLDWLAGRLNQQHPAQFLRHHIQRLDELEQRLVYAQRHGLRHRNADLTGLAAKLTQHNPSQRIETYRTRLQGLHARACALAHNKVGDERRRFAGLTRALAAVSPLATLSRGFAIVTREIDGAIVRDAKEVGVGERVEARLHQGRLRCSVVQTEES